MTDGLLLLASLSLHSVRFCRCVSRSGLRLPGDLIPAMELFLQGLNLLLLSGKGILQRLDIGSGDGRLGRCSGILVG